jgi:Rieske 2Fe-2S family protein
MGKSESDLIARLAANTKIGYSLDRKFYCDDDVFEADMDQVIGRKWIVAGHVDRVRNKGDYFLYKIGNESIIIVRSD